MQIYNEKIFLSNVSFNPLIIMIIVIVVVVVVVVKSDRIYCECQRIYATRFWIDS